MFACRSLHLGERHGLQHGYRRSDSCKAFGNTLTPQPANKLPAAIRAKMTLLTEGAVIALGAVSRVAMQRHRRPSRVIAQNAIRRARTQRSGGRVLSVNG